MAAFVSAYSFFIIFTTNHKSLSLTSRSFCGAIAMISDGGDDKGCDGQSSVVSLRIDGPIEDTLQKNCSIESGITSNSPASGEPNDGTISTQPKAKPVPTGDQQLSTVLPAQGLSKSRKKKLEKRERARQKKLERKANEKAKRLADAIAQGRDLEEERRFVEERTRSGDRQRHLDEIWEAKRQEAKERRRFEICIDLGARRRSEDDGTTKKEKKRIRAVFEEAMREREIASLAQQIRYCYSYNKKSPNPVFASVTGLTLARENVGAEDDPSYDYPTVRELLERETGFLEWNRRMFDCTEKPLEEYYALSVTASNTMSSEGINPIEDSNQKRIVYLTSDSSNTLEKLDDKTVYVIGGIVDRNRLKRATIDRAEGELKVETAKLPLQEYLMKNNISMTTTKVLTVNHVFDILLKYRYFNDWNKAFAEVLPSRKV